ncbi:hypothetical protein [Parafrankia sp. FMc2]|uniref:hypothetical protein n=1 Tax=Parafrankia sp. FMc2 TaxID=3233196 RepID=UPI0034D76234
MIGEGVRRVRTARKDVRQDDVAKAARSFGLRWDYSRVAALERGEKAIDAEELALLPRILTVACTRPVKLPDLIDPNVWVEVGALVMPGSDLVKIYGGQSELRAQVSHKSPDGWTRRSAEVMRAWEDRDRLMQLGAIAEGTEHYDLHALVAAVTVGLTEERTARRIGERPLVVAYLSRILWGRPLGEQRDRLVSERADAGEDPARLRALRGRVTRQLVDEMAAEIKRREAHSDLYARLTRLAEEWAWHQQQVHDVLGTPAPDRRPVEGIERDLIAVRDQFREAGLPLPPPLAGFPDSKAGAADGAEQVSEDTE